MRLSGPNGELDAPALYRLLKGKGNTMSETNGTNGNGPKAGLASSEVLGLPTILGFIGSLIGTGQIDLSSERMQIIVVLGSLGAWALLFIGRTALKANHTKAASLATAAQGALESALKEYEKKTGKDLPLPSDPPRPQPVAMPAQPSVPGVG